MESLTLCSGLSARTTTQHAAYTSVFSLPLSQFRALNSSIGSVSFQDRGCSDFWTIENLEAGEVVLCAKLTLEQKQYRKLISVDKPKGEKAELKFRTIRDSYRGV